MAQVNYLDNGLVLITKQSGTSVSSISIDNCFSDQYKQYKIIFDINASGTCSMKLRVNGLDTSTSNYTRQYYNIFSTSIDTLRQTSQTQWEGVGSIGTGSRQIHITEILNPFQSTYTTAISESPYTPEGNISLYIVSLSTTTTTSYDGFSIIPVSGTITGTIYVYGYVES